MGNCQIRFELVQSGDMDALINKSRRVPNLKNRVYDATELAVIDFATQYPAYGQHRTSNEWLCCTNLSVKGFSAI